MDYALIIDALQVARHCVETGDIRGAMRECERVLAELREEPTVLDSIDPFWGDDGSGPEDV